MNICIFCASSNTVSEQLRAIATKMGQYIAENQHTLVYGGANGGLMTDVAQAVRNNNGEVIGVISQAIIDMGRTSDLPTELLKVDTMATRKQLMKEMADVIVVLPGGIGTYDEFFDAISSAAVGEHDTPTILMNVDNFYEGILLQIKRMTVENLGYKSDKMGLHVCNSLEETFEKLNAFAAEFE